METAPHAAAARREQTGSDTDVPDAHYAPLEGLAPGSREAQEQQRESVMRLGLPLEIRTNVAGIRLRLIPAGTFMMGSPVKEQGRRDDEVLHRVTLSRPFYMGAVEVTQAQWKRVMDANPSFYKGSNLPLECISWDDCQEFLKKLCEIEGVPEGRYRLPTEAEWEYACRAGTQTPYSTGKTERDLARAGWYVDNAGDMTHPVAQKAPNAWGLYDMHGNVWEWCADLRGLYPSGDATDPRGPETGLDHVLRGGCWRSIAKHCRSAYRIDGFPVSAYDFFGFRICM